MLNERIDSLNETKSFFLLENNDILPYNGNIFKYLNKINLNSNESIEDKDTSKNKNIYSYNYINKKGEDNTNRNDGITIELKERDNKNSHYLKNKNDNQYDFLIKIVDNNEGNAPLLYSFDKILNLFKKEENKNKFNKIIPIYNNEEVIKEKFLLLDNKKCFNEENNQIKDLICNTNQQDNKNVNKNSYDNKRGRKTNEIKDKGTHNKMVPDNIIKKIKAKIFEYPIIFLNNILNKKKTEDKLFKLDYQYVNRLNREQDLKYLDLKLKELFSKEISPKYITEQRQKDSNKKFISNLLTNQSDNTILFAFNITFRDWLDVFTLKKNFKDIIFKYDYLEKDIDYERIQKSLYGVDNLLNKIMVENNKEYLTMFIFLLYNYERWFYNKKGRKTKTKRK